jgi:hypothetical protein
MSATVTTPTSVELATPSDGNRYLSRYGNEQIDIVKRTISEGNEVRS